MIAKLKARVSSLLLVVSVLLAAPAAAWDKTGHLTVARIAWERMSPAARAAAAELLAAVPEDADLRQLLPAGSRPLAERQAEHFQLAAYWPDIVRDGDFPERREKYHHGDWHYVNHFFETRGPDNTPHERTDMELLGRLIERLDALVPTLGAASLPAAERGIRLAWVLHLAGDVHQPLHATGRVTPTEPQGDRGGNLFELHGRWNLHSFWDRILRESYTRWWFQSEDSYVRRIAGAITGEHPASEFGERVESRDFAAWARESFEISMASVYPPELERGRKPPRSYKAHALATAEERVALAGYRLANLLDQELGAPQSEPGR